ncbi:MAG: acyl carrier protein [Gammaproteobacteria bacterium]|nr:acyl carrier protein [Gammaproteobacteria bacterium]
MAESLEARLIGIIEATLREQSGNEALALGVDDSMDTLGEWDSLSFMSVFCAVNEAFGIDPDFDDAIHYTSIASLHAYLERVTS